MRGNFSPARKVRSTTAPLSRLFTFVRTNAPPLPGFTCWKSTIRQAPPSSSMCMPFLNWFVLTCSATGAYVAACAGVFRTRGHRRRGRLKRPVDTIRSKGNAGTLADVDDVFAQLGQVLDARRSDDDVVFDPNAAAAFEVDPRLDGHDVAWLERVGRFSRQPRRFVNLQAETMAQAVAECAVEAGRVDDV